MSHLPGGAKLRAGLKLRRALLARPDEDIWAYLVRGALKAEKIRRFYEQASPVIPHAAAVQKVSIDVIS